MTDKPRLPSGPRHIAAGELYPIEEASRRLGWGRKTMIKAQRDGLKAVLYGRTKYVRGQVILDFFERLEGKADGGNHDA